MKKIISNYTKDTTKAIKAAERLFCTTTEDGTIYLCSGYWMFKMTAEEYAAIAQPVTHCDAGNWTIDHNGRRDGNTGKNLLKIFDDAAKAAEHKPALDRSLLSLDRRDTSANLYHSPDGFAAAYDRRYISAICCGQQLRAPGATSPAVFYDCNNRPFALVMPIRLDAKDTRAVMAYFTEPSDDTNEAESLRAELHTAATVNAELEQRNADQANQLEALRAKIAELEARHNAAPEIPAPAPQPAQADGKTAAELIAARFTAFAGVTASIKGAQTASPVIWLDGDTERHAEAIKAAGGKWSNKRSAFYVRVA